MLIYNASKGKSVVFSQLALGRVPSDSHLNSTVDTGNVQSTFVHAETCMEKPVNDILTLDSRKFVGWL